METPYTDLEDLDIALESPDMVLRAKTCELSDEALQQIRDVIREVVREELQRLK